MFKYCTDNDTYTNNEYNNPISYSNSTEFPKQKMMFLNNQSMLDNGLRNYTSSLHVHIPELRDINANSRTYNQSFNNSQKISQINSNSNSYLNSIKPSEKISSNQSPEHLVKQNKYIKKDQNLNKVNSSNKSSQKNINDQNNIIEQRNIIVSDNSPYYNFNQDVRCRYNRNSNSTQNNNLRNRPSQENNQSNFKNKESMLDAAYNLLVWVKNKKY